MQADKSALRYGKKGFYDHVIRNEQDYLARWKYIDENPLKWKDDELFQE
jgi:hypothetical protein